MSVKRRSFRAVSVLTLSAFLLAQIPRSVHAQDELVPPVADTAPVVNVDACRNIPDSRVREQLQSVTKSALTQQLSQIDYAVLVEKHWREVNMDTRLDREIDEAIRIERAATTLLDRAYSTISQEEAEKTAIAVAERAYGSEGFKAALSDLAQGVGRDFGQKLEEAAQNVSGPVIGCVHTALQSRYGGAMAQVFERETQDQLSVIARTGEPSIASGDLLLENVGTISGIVLIVSRRIIARLVASIGRRVAGLVASRIVSTFTGLVGLALIAHDLYQASAGVFPLIEERMKSAEAKELIKQELAQSIRKDLTAQLDTIAAETTERVYAVWQDFQVKYDALLNLAKQYPDFAEFLKGRKPDEIGRLGQLVGFLSKQDGGETGVLQRLRDGTLDRALAVLDDRGVALTVEIGSLERALKWAELAGANFDKAITYGLPQNIMPDRLTSRQLNRLLSLDSGAAALRIARLDPAARERLLSLPENTFRTLARRLSQKELNALATYLQRLDGPAAQRILREVARNPGLMTSLTSSGVQEAVIKSRDQLSAVRMLLRDNRTLDIANIADDLALVREGQVNYRVFVQRYWVGVLIVFLAALLLLLLLRRLIVGTPAKVVIKRGRGGR